MNRPQIVIEFDHEARVWFARSDDVKGLTIEAANLTQLGQRLHEAVPLLLRLNNCDAWGIIDHESTL